MNITNTSNSALARHLSFDPSFISRLRRGVRTPAKNENYIKEIAGYLARHCIEEYQRAALCKALRIPSTKLPVESEDKAELICHWLLEEKSDDTKSVESFLDELKNNCLNCGNSKKKRWQDEQTVKQLVARLNRIEGQVRGIKRMIEEDAYCDDVLNQISSIQSALNGVAKLLLEKHMKSCVKDQLLDGDEQVIDEVLKTIFKMIR